MVTFTEIPYLQKYDRLFNMGARKLFSFRGRYSLERTCQQT